jgi:ABC-type dipeptide/oligopeptide/nickel transport system ATPase subunit
MLEAKQIDYKYNGNQGWILSNVNLSIDRGEIVGLFGHSGQGKTTLAKILAGYLMPSAGQVRVDQHDLPGTGYCPVQMVFQHPETSLNPRWRIADSLAEAGPAAEESFRSFHVEKEWLDKKPYELSGGQLQRVAIARVLRPETRYLLADEITTMLDALTQARIWEILLSFAKKNHVGVLVISHDAHLMNRVCDRVVDIAQAQAKYS